MRAVPGRLVILGHPLHHSLSPRMHNAALRHAGIPLTYEAMDVQPADLPAALAELALENGAGNVTIPHKVMVAEACARLTAVARRVGAVNTFWTEAGRLTGDNTDVAGFDALVVAVLGEIPADARVALIGAGGAAAAVCAAVEQWPGGRVQLANRDPARGDRLRARFPALVTPASSVASAVHEATVVVNATPVGLGDDAFPAPLEALRRDAAVMDLAYRPGETAWVRGARAAGHPAADGLEMLIVQGVRAFERWFGFAPDVDVMRAAVAA